MRVPEIAAVPLTSPPPPACLGGKPPPPSSVSECGLEQAKYSWEPASMVSGKLTTDQGLQLPPAPQGPQQP